MGLDVVEQGLKLADRLNRHLPPPPPPLFFNSDVVGCPPPPPVNPAICQKPLSVPRGGYIFSMRLIPQLPSFPSCPTSNLTIMEEAYVDAVKAAVLAGDNCGTTILNVTVRDMGKGGGVGGCYAHMLHPLVTACPPSPSSSLP